MKTIKSILCFMLVAMLCASLTACYEMVPTESWISESVTVSGSDASQGDDNTDNTVTVGGTTTAGSGVESGDEDNTPNNTTDSVKDDNATVTTTGDDTTPGKTTVENTVSTTTKNNNKTTGGKIDNKTTAKTTTVKNDTPVGDKTTATTKTTRARKSNDTVYRNITVAKSSTKLEDTVSSLFKGKTYKSLMWTESNTGSYSAELQAFAKKYGCTIVEKAVNFESVQNTISVGLASGDAYDIIRVQGSWYPRMLISNLLTPLDGSFTTADLVTSSNKDGIDLEKSKYFAWNDSLYAVTSYDDVPVYYMYYNKLKLKGADDPWTLYKNGQWTWQKMKELAAKYTFPSQGQYWSDYSVVAKPLLLSNDTNLVVESDNGGSVKLRTSISGNTNFINALKMGQGMLNIGKGAGDGLYGRKLVLKGDGATDRMENLLSGATVTWFSESGRYQSLYKRVKSSEGAVAFNMDPNNLGVAPLPTGPDNKSGAYPAGWLVAFAAGRGSDATAPKLVATLCKYHSAYNVVPTNALDKAAYEAEQKVRKTMQHVYDNLNYVDYGYGTAYGTLDNVQSDIVSACIRGADITSTLMKYDSVAARYLEDALSKQ